MPRHVGLDTPATLLPEIVRGSARGRIVADRADGAVLVVRPVGVSISGISKALSRAGE